jgi:hypothetical protein
VDAGPISGFQEEFSWEDQDPNNLRFIDNHQVSGGTVSLLEDTTWWIARDHVRERSDQENILQYDNFDSNGGHNFRELDASLSQFDLHNFTLNDIPFSDPLCFEIAAGLPPDIIPSISTPQQKLDNDLFFATAKTAEIISQTWIGNRTPSTQPASLPSPHPPTEAAPTSPAPSAITINCTWPTCNKSFPSIADYK